MRFFTRDLYERSHSDDGTVSAAASDEFERNLLAYQAQLSTLRTRMSVGTYALFERGNTHDATLLSVRFGDDRTERHGRSRSQLVNKRHVGVRLRLRLLNGKTAEYRYAGIRRAAMQYSVFDDWNVPHRNAVDDLLADEVFDAGDGFIAHHLLFSSGATLELEFKRVSCQVRGRAMRS